MEIEIAPDGSASLSLRPGAAERAPEPGGGLYLDIEDTLTAILNGASVEEFVKARTAPRPEGVAGVGILPGLNVMPGAGAILQGVGPDDAATARGKYQAILDAFPEIGELRQRVWLRKTSKVPVLVDVGWEVLHREVDSSDTSTIADGGRYGLLRLGSAQSVRGLPLTQDVALLGVDLRDVRQLLDELERLRSALAGEG